MFRENTRQINRRMVGSFLVCGIVLITLLILNAIHIFSFADKLIGVIKFIGLPVSIAPLILYYLKVPDEILKYLMAISLSVTIGLIGCFNDIGIYISFALVPVASCMYFDKRFTLFCSGFSYVAMVLSVYVNSGGKLEVIYQGRTHFSVFRGYIIGFTMEYIIVTVCIYQIMKKAMMMLKDQHEADVRSISQDARYQLLVKETNDVVFEYDPKKKIYTANRSIYPSHGKANEAIVNVTEEEILKVQPKLVSLIDFIKERFEAGVFEDFEVDLSFVDEDGRDVPLWYSCECFTVYDGEEPMSVIGKLHDITRIRLLQEKASRQRINNIYEENKRQNSLYEQVAKESANFTEADFERLSEGHQYLLGLFENVKYREQTPELLLEIIGQIGDYFNMDRILVVEVEFASGTNTINYQWASNKAEMLVDYFTHMSPSDIEATKRTYDTWGYIECNPTHQIITSMGSSEQLQENAIISVLLGNQIWIPTLSEGEYTGAIQFDRYDTTPYTMVEKYLLYEAVNSLDTHIKKLNAENANKAKSDFLSTMSHEIRTPMNAIVGMTEVALREDMSPSVKKSLKMVKSSAFGLLTLINDILDFSKIEAGRFEIVPEDFSTLSIINDVKEIAGARNAGKLEIRMDIPEDLPAVLRGDSVRIRQVMINFCTNAIKYTDRGYIRIKVRVKDTGDGAGKLLFSVKDTGIGIRREDIPKLFKTYTQVDTTVNHHKEGTGLGLAISRQLVELMGGYVNVYSEYGEGSEFTFTVPVNVVDGTAAGRLEDFNYEDTDNADTDDEVMVVAPDAKVLIVDDTELNLMVAEALMEPTQMQIDTADSGKTALALLERNRYDIIFMDHFMPEMDGVETTKCIREIENVSGQHTPIIALTADAMAGVREELLGAGMDDFLSKPIVIKELNTILKKWLGV